MRKPSLSTLVAIISFLLSLGFEVSGFQSLKLAIALWVITIILTFIAVYQHVPKARMMLSVSALKRLLLICCGSLIVLVAVGYIQQARSQPFDPVILSVLFCAAVSIFYLLTKTPAQQVIAAPDEKAPDALPIGELQKSISIIEELNQRLGVLNHLYKQQYGNSILIPELKERALYQAKHIEAFLRQNFPPHGPAYVKRFLDDEVTLLNPEPDEPRDQFMFWLNNRRNRVLEFINEQKERIGVIR